MMHGLATAGSPEAQHALITLAEDTKLTNKQRALSMLALLRTKRPTSETVEATIRALSDPLLRVHAIYGAGTYARILREGADESAANRLTSALVAELKSSQDPQATVHLLRGISNSAYSGALSAVEPFLSHEDPDVRTAAVDGIRLMQDPRVDGLLAAQLRDLSTGSDVRLAAVAACGHRPATKALLEPLLERAREDEGRSVRHAAIRQLGEWKTQFPEARTVLSQIANGKDEDPIREAARVAMES
jgi:HEAT repeat protein